jgi:hypothetical protein
MSNKRQTLIFLLFTFTLILLGFLSISTPKSNVGDIEKVRVDSVSVDLRYPNLPDKVWFYHTERGVFTTNKEICSVGDSIEVQIIKIKKW